jgi:hypothetical protein
LFRRDHALGPAASIHLEIFPAQPTLNRPFPQASGTEKKPVLGIVDQPSSLL